MSGRYIVLAFEDRHQADAFVSNELALKYDGARVEGIYLKPSTFCECPDKDRQNVKNWKRGKRSGVFLCVRCKKASVYHEKGLAARFRQVFGYDLRETE